MTTTTDLDLDVAILGALPARIVPAEWLYGRVAPAAPGLAYGDFFAALMSLESRGLVVTNEVWGKGDKPPRITVAHPHVDRRSLESRGRG